MWDFLSNLLNTNGFPPRWRCGSWSSALGWLHIIADLAIFAAYVAIPIVLIYVTLCRKDIYFPKLVWLFGLFILSCGTVHLVEATLFWFPWYRLSGLVKLVTATTSWATVIALVPILPKLLALPGLKSTAARLEEESAKLKQTEALFRSALEACPSGMMLIDSSGRILFANSVVLDWFSYGRDELIGQSVEVLVPPSVRDSHAELRQSFFANPSARAMGEGRDLSGLAKDGTEIPIEIGLNPVTASDGVLVLANVINISHRKRMEAALIAKSEEMEQLMYVVSHDLRSPLVTIEGFTGMIGEHLEAHQLDRVSDDLVRVKRATQTMAHLIRDILELSRINRQRMNLGRVNSRDVLDDAAASLDGPLKRANAQLAIEGDFPTIRADRNQLLQVFLNLIGNALKFGCARPNSTVTVGGVRLEQEVAFYVHDDGPGVDESSREKIFQPFHRGDHEREGSGLGLAIVRNVMGLHGGRVWVESTLGDGATFWFAFPAATLCPPTLQLA